MSALIFKLVGGLFIVFCGYCFSVNLTDRLKAKISFADGLLSGFVSLEEYICSMLCPAEEALCLAANDAGDASRIFVLASKGSGNLRERFSQALSGFDEIYFDAISGVIRGISASDDRERRTAFSIIRTRLNDIREDAEREYERLGKLYNRAGVMVGIMIAILLF